MSYLKVILFHPLHLGSKWGRGLYEGWPTGSFGRVIQSNKVYKNKNKRATLKLHKGLFVPSLPPRNKFTKDSKLYLTLQSCT